MQTTDRKQEILAAIDAEHAIWEDLSARATPDRLDAPLNDAWTFGKLAKHLAAWSEVSLERFEAVAANQEIPVSTFLPESEDVDEINAYFIARDADLDPREAIRTYSRSYDRWHELVERLPESALTDPTFFADLEGHSIYELVVPGPFFEHLVGEHAAEIEAWRKLSADKP